MSSTAVLPSISFFIVSTIIISSVSFLYLLLFPWFFSALKTVPGPSFHDGHFIWGHYPSIPRSQAGIIQREWAHTYGTVVRAVGPFGFERLVFTSIPALRTILIDKTHRFDKPRWVAQILGITTGSHGVLAASGQEHRSLRHWFALMFSKRNTVHARAAVARHANAVCDSLAKKVGQFSEDAILKYPLVSRLALDVAASTIIGVEPFELGKDWDDVANASSLKVPGVDTFLQSDLCYRIAQRTESFVSRWLPALEPVYVTVNSMHVIRSAAGRIVATRLRQNADSTPEAGVTRASRDFLSLVTDRHSGLHSNDKHMHPTDPLQATEIMVDQVLAFVGAGHETIAGAVPWALWLLASHPDVQRNLRDEIDSYGLAEDLCDSALHRLPCLAAVIHESLRLFPPIPTSFREAMVDTWVDGTFVPKVTMIYIGIRTMNMLEAYWGLDAAEFCPERWMRT
ncbi:cytochrome P450 [Cytidiella melzeri]|nr:cytochrome P450 [Cytidiella melzeri]